MEMDLYNNESNTFFYMQYKPLYLYHKQSEREKSLYIYDNCLIFCNKTNLFQSEFILQLPLLKGVMVLIPKPLIVIEIALCGHSEYPNPHANDKSKG